VRSIRKILDLAFDPVRFHFLPMDCWFTPAGLPAAPAGEPLQCPASPGPQPGEEPEGV
jgi:hypothetical protein